MERRFLVSLFLGLDIRLMRRWPHVWMLRPHVTWPLGLLVSVLGGVVSWGWVVYRGPSDIPDALQWFWSCTLVSLTISAGWFWIQVRDRRAIPRGARRSLVWSPLLALVSLAPLYAIPFSVMALQQQAIARLVEPMDLYEDLRILDEAWRAPPRCLPPEFPLSYDVMRWPEVTPRGLLDGLAKTDKDFDQRMAVIQRYSSPPPELKTRAREYQHHLRACLSARSSVGGDACALPSTDDPRTPDACREAVEASSRMMDLGGDAVWIEQLVTNIYLIGLARSGLSEELPETGLRFLFLIAVGQWVAASLLRALERSNVLVEWLPAGILWMLAFLVTVGVVEYQTNKVGAALPGELEPWAAMAVPVYWVIVELAFLVGLWRLSRRRTLVSTLSISTLSAAIPFMPMFIYVLMEQPHGQEFKQMSTWLGVGAVIYLAMSPGLQWLYARYRALPT